jgi:hypothetical protein
VAAVPEAHAPDARRASLLRDVFADVLRGIAIAEEAIDISHEPRVVHMGVATEVPASAPAEAAPAALPPYDQARFEQTLGQWNALIQSGKRTAQQVIDTLRTKATLTEQQEQGIRALETPPDVTQDAAPAEAAPAATPTTTA